MSNVDKPAQLIALSWGEKFLSEIKQIPFCSVLATFGILWTSLWVLNRTAILLPFGPKKEFLLNWSQFYDDSRGFRDSLWPFCQVTTLPRSGGRLSNLVVMCIVMARSRQQVEGTTQHHTDQITECQTPKGVCNVWRTKLSCPHMDITDSNRLRPSCPTNTRGRNQEKNRFQTGGQEPQTSNRRIPLISVNVYTGYWWLNETFVFLFQKAKTQENETQNDSFFHASHPHSLFSGGRSTASTQIHPPKDDNFETR